MLCTVKWVKKLSYGGVFDMDVEQLQVSENDTKTKNETMTNYLEGFKTIWRGGLYQTFPSWTLFIYIYAAIVISLITTATKRHLIDLTL